MIVSSATASSKHQRPQSRHRDAGVTSVLVVDADDSTADASALALKGAGFEVMIAQDGNNGLAMALVYQPDVIVLASRLPKRSGFLVLEYLCTQTDFSCPVVFVTDRAVRGEGRNAKYAALLGASVILEKPFTGPVMLQSVQQALGSAS